MGATKAQQYPLDVWKEICELEISITRLEHYKNESKMFGLDLNYEWLMSEIENRELRLNTLKSLF